MTVSFETKEIRRFYDVGRDVYSVRMEIPKTAVQAVDDLLAKKVTAALEVTIGGPTEKRTLTANAYLWALCDEIAKAAGTDKDAVYRALVRRVGVFDFVVVSERAADTFAERWERKGLGWFTVEVPSIKERVKEFVVYYGTSVYTKEEMARVIDEAEMEARGLGLSVKSEEEKERLKWDL